MQFARPDLLFVVLHMMRRGRGQANWFSNQHGSAKLARLGALVGCLDVRLVDTCNNPITRLTAAQFEG